MSAQPHHTHAAASSARNPMVYDVLRETAMWLSAEYMAREDAATTAEESQLWAMRDQRLLTELDDIDPRDHDLVRAKTAEYAHRREGLPPL